MHQAKLTSCAKSRPAGFSLIEVLVVIAVIAMLAALLVPALASAKRKAQSAKCASNIRQIAMATILYGNDTPDIGLPYDNGDWVNPPYKGEAGGGSWNVGFRRTISQYLGGKSDVMWCPADKTPRTDDWSSTTKVPPLYAETEKWQNWDVGSYGLNACIAHRVRAGGRNGGRNNYFFVSMPERSQLILVAEDKDDHVSVPEVYWPASGWCECSLFGRYGARHNGKGHVAFCDGHVELLAEAETLPPPVGVGPRDMWVPADGKACSGY